METLLYILASCMTWLPRAAFTLLFIAGVSWLASVGVGWLRPPLGDPVPAFENIGDNDQSAFLPKLLEAEFASLKSQLLIGAVGVDRQLTEWQKQFESVDERRRQASILAQPAATAQGVAPGSKAIISQQIPSADLSHVKDIAASLQLLSKDLSKADIPDIKIASVDVGPILRWVFALLKSPAENKVVVFDAANTALIEGPIIGGDKVIMTLDPLKDGTKRQARDIAQSIAYEILTYKLRSGEPSLDFGDWTGLRDFVEGTAALPKLISGPLPDEANAAAWRARMKEAAGHIEQAGSSARNWKLIALASFILERGDDLNAALGTLERHASLVGGDEGAEKNRKARIDYLRNRRAEVAVAGAVDKSQSDGSAFVSSAEALAALPIFSEVRKLHRLGGSPGGTRIKVAIIGGRAAPWFGIGAASVPVPLEGSIDLLGAQLALFLRALTPAVDISFFPFQDREEEPVADADILKAMNKAASSDADILIVPYGPLFGSAIFAQVFDNLLAADKLVIIPAGNRDDGQHDPVSALIAQTVDASGRRPMSSPPTKGAFGVYGSEVPSIVLTDSGPTIELRSGSSYATATFAAIVAETMARQPELKGRSVLAAVANAARKSASGEEPVARVAFP